MNVIVDIYLDKNIGDDLMGELFIKSLTDKGWNCFIPNKDEILLPDSITKIKNVKIIDEINQDFLLEQEIKCYIKVGGSIFPHGTVMEGIKRYKYLKFIKMLKKKNIKIGIFGCSLGPFFSKVGISATKKIIKLSDVITCRDKKSFELISEFKPVNSHLYSDIVLGSEIEPVKNLGNDIGVSVYTGYAPYLKKYNSSYAKFLVNLLKKYSVDQHHSKIKLFLFDTGYNSDFPVANYIINELEHLNIEIISYNGNTNDFIEQMRSCKLIIGSRFHSIILGLKLRIPILPIIYSSKTTNLLNDLHYKGIRIEINSCDNININEVIQQIIGGNLLVNIERRYEENAKGHLNELEKLILNI